MRNKILYLIMLIEEQREYANEEKEELVSILNFERHAHLFSKREFLTSPFSKEACLNLGVLEHELIPRTKADLRHEPVPREFKQDPELYHNILFENREYNRQLLINALLQERDELIEQHKYKKYVVGPTPKKYGHQTDHITYKPSYKQVGNVQLSPKSDRNYDEEERMRRIQYMKDLEKRRRKQQLVQEKLERQLSQERRKQEIERQRQLSHDQKLKQKQIKLAKIDQQRRQRSLSIQRRQEEESERQSQLKEKYQIMGRVQKEEAELQYSQKIQELEQKKEKRQQLQAMDKEYKQMMFQEKLEKIKEQKIQQEQNYQKYQNQLKSKDYMESQRILKLKQSKRKEIAKQRKLNMQKHQQITTILRLNQNEELIRNETRIQQLQVNQQLAEERKQRRLNEQQRLSIIESLKISDAKQRLLRQQRAEEYRRQKYYYEQCEEQEQEGSERKLLPRISFNNRSYTQSPRLEYSLRQLKNSTDSSSTFVWPNGNHAGSNLASQEQSLSKQQIAVEQPYLHSFQVKSPVGLGKKKKKERAAVSSRQVYASIAQELIQSDLYLEELENLQFSFFNKVHSSLESDWQDTEEVEVEEVDVEQIEKLIVENEQLCKQIQRFYNAYQCFK